MARAEFEAWLSAWLEGVWALDAEAFSPYVTGILDEGGALPEVMELLLSAAEDGPAGGADEGAKLAEELGTRWAACTASGADEAAAAKAAREGVRKEKVAARQEAAAQQSIFEAAERAKGPRERSPSEEQAYMVAMRAVSLDDGESESQGSANRSASARVIQQKKEKLTAEHKKRVARDRAALKADKAKKANLKKKRTSSKKERRG
jgi:hypothetical protein